MAARTAAALATGALAAALAACGAGNAQRPAAQPARELTTTGAATSSPTTATVTPTPAGTPTPEVAPCLEPAAGAGEEEVSAPIPPTVVNVMAPTTAAPARTDLLPRGEGPTVAWLTWPKGRPVLHDLGRAVPVADGDMIFGRMWGGYVTVTGLSSGMDYSWTRPGRPPTELMAADYDKAVPILQYATAKAFGAVVEDPTLRPPWRADLVGPNGCRQTLDFTAAQNTLRSSGRSDAACDHPVPIGFTAPTEYAASFMCTTGSRKEQFVLTTAGRVLSTPGARIRTWLEYPVMSRSAHVLIVLDDNLEALVIRAFDTRTGQPLWSHSYQLHGYDLSFGDIQVSPDGRRVMFTMLSTALIVDLRTGQPAAVVSAPASVKRIAYESDNSVLLVDNGVVEGYRETSKRSPWIVRCTLGGSCELATAVPPPRPHVWIDLLR